MRDRPDLLTHSCGRCGARWSGLDRAHCTACPAHRTFDDVELYDAHREAGRCLPPSRLGLVRNKGGIWQRRTRPQRRRADVRTQPHDDRSRTLRKSGGEE